MARAGLSAERVTRAAAELADEVGVENVTVSALARRFGVKDASLYSHLRNVHELRVRLAGLALTELADRVADALAGRSGKQALAAFTGAYRDYATEHPGRYAAGQLRLDADAPADSPAVAAAIRHSTLTRAVLRGYDVPESEHVHAVRFVHSAVHGFVSLERSGGFDHSGEVAGSWARLLDVLDAALRSWPAGT
ncbi:MAG TPA: WHG domain-containing protein [Actinophytocola sp.]|jgi:AcrR family transcriptional regulator|nr:WHG domain-containing protein [Actinophytocola sp.]